MRLLEAQQLSDGLNDVLLRPALEEFLRSQVAAHTDMLLNQIKLRDRDTMKEARLAGQIDVYETFLSEIEHFSRRMMKEAAE